MTDSTFDRAAASTQIPSLVVPQSSLFGTLWAPFFGPDDSIVWRTLHACVFGTALGH